MPGCNNKLSELYKNALNEMEMEGGFSVDDIVDGRKVLANGAVAGFVMVDGKRKWRIVAGADASYMAEIRGQKGAPKPISKRAALIAFNKAYKNKSARSKALDRNFSGERGPVVADSRYKRSPKYYDFAGVDAGPKTRKKRSDAGTAATKARMEALRAKKKGAKSAPKKASPAPLSLEGGAVDLKQAVKLLRSYYDNKYN